MAHIYQRILERFQIIDSNDASLIDTFAPSAQWLDNPGCVFQRADLVLAGGVRTEGVIKPGLFVTVVLKGAGSGGPHQGAARLRYADNTIAVMALREPTPCTGAAPRGASLRVAGLAFPRASIERMGFRQEFLDLFEDADANVFTTSLKAPPRMLALATEMISPTIGGRAGQLLLSAYATEIFVRVISAMQLRSKINLVADRAHWRMQSVRNAIDADLKRDWRVSDLARRAGISRRSFNIHFRRLFGASAADYLRTKRLETARDAIVQNGCSVSEAAYLVGYGNPANFATAFRKHFGSAPSQYRA